MRSAENNPKCVLREYIETLESGKYGKTYIKDPSLDQDGNGYGSRDCDACKLRIIAANGIPKISKAAMVEVCIEITDPELIPNIIC